MNASHVLYASTNFCHFAAESQLVADENDVWFENKLYGTKPVVIHGNGPSKVCELHVIQAHEVT